MIVVGSVRCGGRVEGEWRDHRGQAVPLALVVVVLAMVLMVAVGSVGGPRRRCQPGPDGG